MHWISELRTADGEMEGNCVKVRLGKRRRGTEGSAELGVVALRGRQGERADRPYAMAPVMMNDLCFKVKPEIKPVFVFLSLIVSGLFALKSRQLPFWVYIRCRAFSLFGSWM
jgi:hypothetical protein